MNPSPKKKSGFWTFLYSLCSSKIVAQNQCQKQKKKCKMRVHKTPRLTFDLDRVLIKISRKNIAQQEFMQNEVLTFHLEKYLIYRLQLLDIVIFQGDFSTFLTQKIPFSLQIKNKKQQAYQNESNYILSNENKMINLRMKAIDALVVQLYFGDNQEGQQDIEVSNKKLTKKQENHKSADIDKIQSILSQNHKKINNFVFICNKDLNLEDVHNLFLVFRQSYLFEFERVKKIEKLVCIIIYVSREPSFVRIDNIPLCQFLISQFQKLKAFEGQKQCFLSNIEKRKTNLSKSSIKTNQKPIQKSAQHQLVNRDIPNKIIFQQLLMSMLQIKLHIQVSQVLGMIIDSTDKSSHVVNLFLSIMHQKYPQTRQLIQNYRNNKKQEKNEEFNKTSSQYTPAFQVRLMQSKDFSKKTALFKTNNSDEEDDFILCDDKNHEQASL